MKKLAFIAATALLASTAVASAHSRSNDVNARQDRQAIAIEEGRKNGTITWREGLKLQKEQREIAATEAQFRADGRLSKSERQTLKSMQDEAAANIAHEKHDGWKRPAFLPRVGR